MKIDYSGQIIDWIDYSNVSFVALPQPFETGDGTGLSVQGLDAVEGEV